MFATSQNYGLRMPEIIRASLVLSPSVLLALATQNPLWLEAAVMTMSTFIAHERCGLAPLGVLAHACAVLVALLTLLCAHRYPIVWIALVTALAMISIRLTVFGSRLRTVGSYTFVPALYLSASLPSDWGIGASHGPWVVIKLMIFGAVPTLLLSVARHLKEHAPEFTSLSHQLRLLYHDDLGDSYTGWAQVGAVACAVIVTASLVSFADMHYGQWMIWSAVTVVAAEVSASRAKLRERCVGGCIGVLFGLTFGVFEPHNAFVHIACVLISLLTLVAFTRYIIGFCVRCAFVVMAAMASGGGALVGLERAGYVLLGGGIGLLSVLIVTSASRLRIQRTRY